MREMCALADDDRIGPRPAVMRERDTLHAGLREQMDAFYDGIDARLCAGERAARGRRRS